MVNNLIGNINAFIQEDVVNYFNELYVYPIKLIPLILDLIIVVFTILIIIKFARNSRVWQLLKGIALFILITWLSGVLKLPITNAILTSILPSGVIALVIIFQPEIRRGLEQLGTNKFTRFFGIDQDLVTKTKEDIYKIAIATDELAKTKTGGLIVIEREVKLNDIIDTGVKIDSEVSPQLIVNLFTPKTPLHDGAVVISNNRISAAACILPLASDKDIAKELGTRHRAAIGMSKESDSIVIVVSEETGKISIAKDGTLIADVNQDVLKKILMKNLITNNENNRLKLKKIKGTKNEEHKTNN